MGRHSLPDTRPRGEDPPGGTDRGRATRRTVVIGTALALAAGTVAVAAAQGALPFAADSCADRAVRLRVVASPDIAPVVREAADRARERHLTSDGRCLAVRVTARDSHAVALELGAGRRTPDYDVWIPDSGAWVERTRLQPESTAVAPVAGIAASPVVLAATPAAASGLGWPKKQYGWGELAAAAVGGGELRTGAADPTASAATLLALGRISASAAALGPDGDVVAAGAAKLLSQRISESDALLPQTLPRDGSQAERADPRRNQAVILSEQAAAAHNTAHRDAHLSLFYPKDGAPLLDYPYTLVDEAHLDLDENRAVMRFLQLLGDEDGGRALARHGFRDPHAAASPAVVRAAGGDPAQPVGATLAQPPTGKDLQEALAMWTITVQSARLTTVVDASGSMAAPVPGHGDRSRMEVTRGSLLQGLATFTPDDEIGLWEFATRLDGPRDYRRLVPTRRLGEQEDDGSTQRQRLVAAFDALTPEPDGATGLYDTALAAYQEARDSYRFGKFNALVILTDGVNEDPGSLTRAALVKRLEELRDPQRPVPLIALAIGPDADLGELGPIAAATGGGAYRVNDPTQIHTVILKAITAVGRG
ncbi:substrate-binding and VWA domain-containing protein [Streptomyces sp. NPDC089919]|uniref:substrate-binding and VWA domain-containing protein n=1 Tax=Streptomyces sp. NPDC089919 TaxID=3155188 RepID=UPI00341FAB45